MIELSLKDVQKIEFDILVHFSSFCKKNNLRFFLCGGTLLGAIRHQGFIPWDDDLDVCMPRPDYDRLMKIYSPDDSNIHLYSGELGNMTAPFAKLKRIDTKIFCRCTDSDVDTNLWVDIFPIDGLPDSQEEQKRIYRKAYFFRQLLTITLSRLWTGRTYFRKVLKCFIRPFAYFIGGKRFSKSLELLARRIPYGSTSYVGCVTWGLHGVPGEVMRQEVFEKSEAIVFCGTEMPIFSCWNQYLSGCYGDYMQLPDEKNRQTHQFRAYLLEASERSCWE